jgi:Domain of unknown function (DUF4340)
VKKETIILGVVIVFLAAFLVFQNTRRTGIQLPHLAPVAGKDLTKIEITHGGKTVTLKRKADDWFIGDEGWPADSMEVEKMVSAISHLQLTALVSESKSYARYDLTADKKTTVSAWAGDKEVRHFDMGKVAQTYQHTFVMLAGDPNVYHAEGNFKSTFDRSAEALRDKRVMSVKADEVKEIHIAGKGEPVSIKREEVPVKKPASTQEQAKEATGAKAAPIVLSHALWKSDAGQEIDRDLVSRFLSHFSQMQCSAYMEGKKKADLTDPIRTITLTADKPYTLSLFKKTDRGYPAVSSEDADPFLLQDYIVDEMLKQIDTLTAKTGKTGGAEKAKAASPPKS